VKSYTEESSRLVILTDETGSILAAFRPGAAEQTGEDGPTYVGIVPSAGQALHDVTLPEGFERIAVPESLHEFYVRIDCGQPTLARR
jgi:hypothetical protein